MPIGGNSNYPPQYANSAVSAMLGAINDLAGGTTNEMRSMSLKNNEAAKTLAALGDLGEGIPVVVTGTRPPTSTQFPGLREAMIGSAIYQLAEQIPADNPLRGQIQEIALQLHYSGGEKISRQRKSKKARRSQEA